MINIPDYILVWVWGNKAKNTPSKPLAKVYGENISLSKAMDLYLDSLTEEQRSAFLEEYDRDSIDAMWRPHLMYGLCFDEMDLPEIHAPIDTSD